MTLFETVFSGNDAVYGLKMCIRDRALTLLGDCLKCVVAILIAKLLFASHQGNDLLLLELYAGAGCVLGHNFPFYLKFKGGKGIAASVGLLLAFDWRLFLICARCV